PRPPISTHSLHDALPISGAAEIRTCGAEALTIPTDVRDYRQVRAMVRTTLDRFGRLDALVNNAAGNFVRPAERLPEEAFRNVIEDRKSTRLNSSHEWISY